MAQILMAYAAVPHMNDESMHPAYCFESNCDVCYLDYPLNDLVHRHLDELLHNALHHNLHVDGHLLLAQ